ncbi:hypothetical protein C4571_02445 [Candidatus Parcubacteria bacterium]|nr:MAG: hypothetical protein C4571_02445 [Candidatus Parcubacteria bacterium]
MATEMINPLRHDEKLVPLLKDMASLPGVPAVWGDLVQFDELLEQGASFDQSPVLLHGAGVVGTKPQVTHKGVTYIFHSAYTQSRRWFLRVTVGQATRSFSIPDLRLMLGLDVGTPELVPAAT